jgi:hypothetical protein
MATVTRTFLVDDLDGSDEDVQSLRFSLDGQDFEIDLGPVNAARLRDKLARFLEHASPVPARRGTRRPKVSRPPASGADQTRAIRQWAADNGMSVSARGRIPKSVMAAFDQAH